MISRILGLPPTPKNLAFKYLATDTEFLEIGIFKDGKIVDKVYMLENDLNLYNEKEIIYVD